MGYRDFIRTLTVLTLIGLLASLVLIASARADEPKGFDSANEAAVSALSIAYNTHPHYYEFGGVIVQAKSGKFAASIPVTVGHADNMSIEEDPEAYADSLPIVGNYHTHPCINGYMPGVFSPADLHAARSLNRPTYILDECTGDVHYWAPGDGYDKPHDKMEELMGVQLATGKIVGHVAVDGKSIEL